MRRIVIVFCTLGILVFLSFKLNIWKGAPSQKSELSFSETFKPGEKLAISYNKSTVTKGEALNSDKRVDIENDSMTVKESLEDRIDKVYRLIAMTEDEYEIDLFFEELYSLALRCLKQNKTCHLDILEYFEYERLQLSDRNRRKAEFLIAQIKEYMTDPALLADDETELMLDIDENASKPIKLTVENGEQLSTVLNDALETAKASSRRLEALHDVNLMVLGAFEHNAFDSLDYESLNDILDKTKPEKAFTNTSEKDIYQSWLSAKRVVNYTQPEVFNNMLVSELERSTSPNQIVELLLFLGYKQREMISEMDQKRLFEVVKSSREEILTLADEGDYELVYTMLSK